MRLALKECAGSPLIRMVQGKVAVSGQSGVHWPVAGLRESPSPKRPNSTTRVRTGATIGICSVSVVGLRQGADDLGPVVTSPLRFPLSDAGGLLRQIHRTLPSPPLAIMPMGRASSPPPRCRALAGAS